jgi:hypothetical protein
MCGCGSSNLQNTQGRTYTKEVSPILNKWCIDNLGRKLLISSPIHDMYNDIIGYMTTTESGNVVRIFVKNIKEIID